MKPQSCKNKGRRLQQQIVDKILKHFIALTADDVRSTSMGCNGEDVQLSPRAREFVPFSIECKNVEKLNIWASLEQAEKNSRTFDHMLIFKRNKSKTYATIELDVLLKLLSSNSTEDSNTTEQNNLNNDESIISLLNEAHESLRKVASKVQNMGETTNENTDENTNDTHTAANTLMELSERNV